MGRFVRGKFLYWGKPLTSYHIALRKAERRFFLIEIAIVGILGLAFLSSFFYVAAKRELFEAMFTPSFWVDPASGSFRYLFWFAIILFSYAIYRSIAIKKDPAIVEERLYEEKTPMHPEPTMMTWEGVYGTKKAKRLDISDTFTDNAQQVLETMYVTAQKYGQEEVGINHMLFALLSSSKIQGVFIRLGIPVQSLQAQIAKAFGQPSKSGLSPRIGSDVQQILFQAYEAAYNARQEYVHVTELLVSTVRASEKIQELLYDLNVDKQKLANVIEWLRIRERLSTQYQKFRKAAARRSKHGMDRAMTAVATPFLNSFSQDITMAAKFGHLSPCVARDKEIEEMFRIIEGGRQSVLLVGQHGVGKMSIIEGIAQRMIEDDTPDRLKDKRLVGISTSALVAGTTVSGAQERLIKIMNEVAHAKNIILFINNVHDLMGSSGDTEGLDVSETLAEYLGRGQFLTFATTIPEGFNRHIANSQMGTVFAPVQVAEMDQNQAIQVLESKVGPAEYKHHVFFSYDALEQSVALAKKYLHDQVLPESAMGLMSESASIARSEKGENTLVSGEDVAKVVSAKTGIPATSITEDESAKLLRLEDEMHKRVIGQDEAVSIVANALRRARAEIRSQNRPIANFLFLGPTGVGKTELAKTIAAIYFGGEQRMIRIDMSEYQDKSGVYRLIGQPGQQGTGILTESVRQNPFSLILLDEMEKADPDILNLFLQVFDDGRLTDSVGRVIDFTNAIIIATSNAGTSYVQEQINQGVALSEIRENIIRGELKKYYRPEFLNRFDGIVLFKSLEREEIKQIASIMLRRVEKDLEAKGIGFRVEDTALEALAEVGFDPEFGARPMRRAIQDHVENNLAEFVLQGKLHRRDVVVLGEGMSMRVESAQ